MKYMDQWSLKGLIGGDIFNVKMYLCDNILMLPITKHNVHLHN